MMSSLSRLIPVSAGWQMRTRQRRDNVRTVSQRPIAERVREWSERWGDIALAVAVTAFVQVGIWTDTSYLVGSKPWFALTSACMTIPLALRRRSPLIVALGIAAVLVLQVAVEPSRHPPDGPFVAWVIAAYSVGAHARVRPALAAIAALVGALELWSSFTGDDPVFVPAILIGFWLAGRVVRSRNLLAATLADRTRELELEREENARLAVAEERARIARELHDVVAHGVSVMVVNAGAERLVLPAEQESTADVLRSIEDAGREALGEMGRLVTMLRAGDEESLDPAPGLMRVEPLLERVRATGLDVELVVDGDPRPLAAGVDVSAFRIVQEALTNVVRHANGSRARVLLTYGPRDLGIVVEDDGGGRQANGRRPAREPGHGLIGIRERASLYGGDLTTGQSDLGGFLVRVRLPLPS
jgi:signal transduction histidine kinase